MKKTSKILLGILCAAILVTVSVAGVLAYLIDTDEVVNTFTVGDVQLELDEADVNPDGTVIEGADRVKGNEYHLIPGSTYTKDPTVTVKANSEESYVRMIVTLNNASTLKEVFGDPFLPQYFVEGWDGAIWETTGVIEEDTTANTLTYEFRYYKTVSTMDPAEDVTLEPLFTSFTMPGKVNNEQLRELSDLTITVNAHAIQSTNLADEEAAWAAFDEQVAPETTNP